MLYWQHSPFFAHRWHIGCCLPHRIFCRLKRYTTAGLDDVCACRFVRSALCISIENTTMYELFAG
ncbi:hypothetical protein CGCA056_v015177 [Colletotrichum aenigma]|uniref:uncharacterized protein n=1 Tax=Colletotrichum aenigma TaxID=1215731 RepID=UPI001872379F|nr:uncharacterized protein CGCA056_v015177 [Colletotrichum aenigma]KAF5483017.1 hypothetical protein CGCA056_v015177 [Colletotrichum aenigma]